LVEKVQTNIKMPLKVAKIYFFSFFREISSTKQMKYAMVLLYYEYIAIYL